jgi:hypothetical protein
MVSSRAVLSYSFNAIALIMLYSSKSRNTACRVERSELENENPVYDRSEVKMVKK